MLLCRCLLNNTIVRPRLVCEHKSNRIICKWCYITRKCKITCFFVCEVWKINIFKTFNVTRIKFLITFIIIRFCKTFIKFVKFLTGNNFFLIYNSFTYKRNCCICCFSNCCVSKVFLCCLFFNGGTCLYNTLWKNQINHLCATL